MTDPTIAYVLRASTTRPTIFITSASGGKRRVTTPTRNPRGDPHPNPGTPEIANRMTNTYVIHGARASQKPILPMGVDPRSTFVSIISHLNRGVTTDGVDKPLL